MTNNTKPNAAKKSSPLAPITKKAKELRAKDPKMKWTDAIKKASALLKKSK